MADWNGFKKNGTTYIPNDATARERISTIEGKIPSAASSSNKLVDTSTMTTELNGKVNVSSVGANNGVAGLDANGRVPSSQLPSYVDDVLEYDSQSDFPATGETGKIYIALDTNKTFRWSGSAYVEISESLALGETSSTAYAGSKGKANADAISAMKDGSSIDSFGDVETALAGKVDKVTGKGLSTNDYNNTAKGIVDNIQSNVIANTQLIKDTVGWSGKNKLLVTLVSTSNWNGITVTVNSDRTISLSGTASANTPMEVGRINVKAGETYRVSSKFRGDNNQGNFVGIMLNKTEGAYDYYLIDEDYIDITPSTDGYMVYKIRIKSGTNTSGFKFYPMITDGDILDDSYEPYFGSTAFPRSEQAVLGAVNILPNDVTSGTVEAVTYSKTSDGGVLVNGTPTEDNVIEINNSPYLTTDEIGKHSYFLSGAPQGCELACVIRSISGGIRTGLYIDTGDGVWIRPLTDNERLEIRINLVNGRQINNKTFYPMLSLSDKDSFVPYAMTNKELTEKHEIKDVTFTAGTGIDVRPATFVKIEDKLLVGYFALKNDTENAMPINTVLATISGVPIHHGANWVLPAVITDNMSNTAVMITHDMTSNTLIFKNQSSLPAGNTITFSLTEYMIKA